jgi:hypothetical protein
MSITQQPDIPLLPPGLLDLSDERDLWFRRVHASWREGYEAALSDAVVESLLRIFPDAEPETRRWELRGEPRTRSSFAQPHPEDFTGKGAA